MSTKISLSLLVITSAFLSAQATTAQNPLFIPKNLVVNNTLDPQPLSTDSSPDLVQIKSAQMDFVGGSEAFAPAIASLFAERLPQQKENRPTEISNDNNLADRQTPIALNPQINVFASDVGTMLQSRGGNQISSTPARSAWETSVEIPVPPPLTQTIKGVKPNRANIVQPIVNSPKIVKIYAKPNPLPIAKRATEAVAQSPITPDQPTTTAPAVPANPASIDSPAVPESSTELIYPLMNPARISSRFGWRTHPLTGKRRFHSGLDLAAPSGAPIVAAGSGTVISAGWNGGYGKAIIIQHSDTQQTVYGHLSEISVQTGQTIAQGTVIGLVGSTGNSTGPHLHFESRMPTAGVWTAVNPTQEIQYALDNLRRSMPYARKNLPPGY
jgi:murein DD-endopeptidase MepM/ murein hydrolase activator NlpD